MKYVKAKLILLLIGAIWGSLIVFSIPLMVVAYIVDRLQKVRHVKHSWLYNLLIAQDIYVNTIFGGHFRTTISSELGNQKRQGSRTGTVVANVVDWLFYVAVQEVDHCVNAIEKEDRHYFNPLRAVVGFTLHVLNLYAFCLLVARLLN